MHEIPLASGSDRWAAWHLPAGRAASEGPGGRPCAVIPSGFAAIRDNSLLGCAEEFAVAGIDALLFDYRGFGASCGLPRQLVSVRRQREDFHAAIAAARRLTGVDAERIVPSGFSYSGGHVVAVAAQDRRAAATNSVTPAMDGIPGLLQLARTAGLRHMARSSAHGLRDGLRALTGRPPYFVAVVGEPGSPAIFAREGSEHLYELRDSPLDHMDVYPGTAQQQIAADQLEFLRRVL
ncbi:MULTISPECIES: alpha/beta hydrolase [unclassified Streptomyces]|uniref:alpha/beta hydrolase n=1 Tax=unclassified Streptomyces TaxID=2593676 RepID=UPI00224CDB50|nr:alpha/beta hydrolase [Streptomyces sp. NBC_00401]MCX5085464.1 alpha/beta hydrolase [Streptomyces sp. NBC_00401]